MSCETKSCLGECIADLRRSRSLLISDLTVTNEFSNNAFCLSISYFLTKQNGKGCSLALTFLMEWYRVGFQEFTTVLRDDEPRGSLRRRSLLLLATSSLRRRQQRSLSELVADRFMLTGLE